MCVEQKSKIWEDANLDHWFLWFKLEIFINWGNKVDSYFPTYQHYTFNSDCSFTIIKHRATKHLFVEQDQHQQKGIVPVKFPNLEDGY